MPDEARAVGLRSGRIQLILGDEVGVTAAEIIATGDHTKLALVDIPGIRHHLNTIGCLPKLPEALLIVDSHDGIPADEFAEDVGFCGLEGTATPPEMHLFDTQLRKGMLAEAALAAWIQRLSDAADSLDPLTTIDAELVGRLAIPGRPLITELRADRRRSGNTTTHGADSTATSRVVLDDLVADLHAAVRYGAAGLADATGELAAKSIELACEQGGWVDRLKLLIAAEEIRAIELAARSSSELLRPDGTAASQDHFDELLAKYLDQRRQAEDLSSLFNEVVTRLPSAPRNPGTRLLRRRAIDDVSKLRQTLDAYSSVVRTPSSPDSPTTTWAATTQTLIALERANADGADPDNQPEDQSTRSMDEAAVLLGELFADRLPAARVLVDATARQHPGVNAEGHIQIIKRQAMRRLSVESRYVASQPIPEVVAELAMAIALLRGFELGTDAEFQKLGLRMITRADKIAQAQAQAGRAIPLVANGFSFFAEHIQPVVTEYVFNRLGALKPSRPGAARNAYKSARSKVWRARHDRDIANAAAGGAADALQRAIDAGAPRLIVRYVDRSLRAPR